MLVETLAPGTQVMIKNARYQGPVIAVTDNNNNVLKDVLGEKLDRSVSLPKVKVI